MRYRRFGKTELQMPVFSVGGMRYQHTWGDKDPSEIPAEAQANLEACIHHALELGLYHIETARGYGTSEMQLGRVLPQIPREQLIVQTKIGPNPDPEKFRANFEKSMGYLKLDYIDLLAFHGINTDDGLEHVMKPGGCLEVVRQLQKEGRVRFVGFSTHGPTKTIVSAVETGEFDYFNVHWYFVNPLNWPAIEAATKLDMGVFIISPTDKGGQLYDPPARLVELCKPLTPIQFNDLYCLSHPEVHTLSIGANKPTDYDEHVAALEYYDGLPDSIKPIQDRIRQAIDETVGLDWFDHWNEGLPDREEIPGDINLTEILRLWTFAKSLDLMNYGKARYNIMGNAGHWAPGQRAEDVDEAVLRPLIAASPFADRIPGILREAHEMLVGEEQKRLSES
jgi:predicted aldo/keto reductase-like oxidoreductase